MVSSPNSEPRNLIRLWVCVVVGVALWFCPVPAGITPPAWHIFAVFVATILSLLLRPLPMGVCVLIGVLVLGATRQFSYAVPESYSLGNPPTAILELNNLTEEELKSIHRRFEERSNVVIYDYFWGPHEQLKKSFAYALSGYADPTTWLVVSAFLIAGAMLRSGLGRRISLAMITRLGGTTLGLGYAIAAAEFVLGPFIPSNTARGGGVMAPIVNSLSYALGSRPDHQPERAGQYLVLVGAHANLIVAATFLTGMAANPLVSKAAKDVLNVEFGWGTWLMGSIAPAVISLAILPLLMHRLTKPQATGDAARQEANKELAAMGGWTAKQVVLALVLGLMLTLWASAPLQKMWLGYSLPTALVALSGVVLLVVLGVEKWSDVTGNAAAWDTLIWLGGLVTMCNALRDTGFTTWFAERIGGYVEGWPAIGAALLLTLVYFYSMYAFSMMTGHIMAMAGVFLAVGAAAGAPPMLIVPLIAYTSNLCGCLTNYSTGPTIIYFGLGYVPIGRWFSIGLLMSFIHLAVWLGVGLPYWKLLGWW